MRGIEIEEGEEIEEEGGGGRRRGKEGEGDGEKRITGQKTFRETKEESCKKRVLLVFPLSEDPV